MNWQPLVSNLPESSLPFSFIRKILEPKKRAWFQKQLEKNKFPVVIEESGPHFIVSSLKDWDSNFFRKKIHQVLAAKIGSVKDGISLLKKFDDHMRIEKADYAYGIFAAEDPTFIDCLGRAGWSLIETR